jgi:hypothetical protein
MKKRALQVGLVLLTLTLVVPESYAKRLGGGRSSGRQSQMSRQRMVPPPTIKRPPPPAPPYARPGPGPRVAPYATRPGYGGQQIPQQTGSRWGGMIGSALLGLGLGSLMSNSHAHEEAQRLEAARQEGIRQEAARQEAVRQNAVKEEHAKKHAADEPTRASEAVSHAEENPGPSERNNSGAGSGMAAPATTPGSSGNW